MKSILVLSAFVSMAFSQGALKAEDAWKELVIADWQEVDHVAAFRGWKAEFGKSYTSLEQEAERFGVFLENWEKINTENQKGNSYTLKLNQFADLREGDEFKQYVHGSTGSCLQKKSIRLQRPRLIKEAVGANPTSIDWTTKGVVTPVKNQGQCGSCWAFSATGSTESRYAIATGKLNSLSEQQLVDCSHAYGNLGCDGGEMDAAFKYIKANGGLCTETEYPYKGVNGKCQSTTCGTFYDKISGYTDVTVDNEADLETAVAAGPVSVAVEADQFAFQFYSGGILNGACGTNLDHGVLAVGYGSQSGQEYWKVKNSWGTSWGEQGYVLICKDCNKNGNKGECGIDMDPSFPIAQS